MPDTFKLVTIFKVATANIRDVLFEGEVGNFGGMSDNLKIPLSNSYKEYDMLGFYTTINNGSNILFYREIPIELLETLTANSTSIISFCYGYSSTDDFINFVNTSTDTELIINVRKTLLTKIVGIKYVNVGTLINNTREVTNND